MHCTLYFLWNVSLRSVILFPRCCLCRCYAYNGKHQAIYTASNCEPPTLWGCRLEVSSHLHPLGRITTTCYWPLEKRKGVCLHTYTHMLMCTYSHKHFYIHIWTLKGCTMKLSVEGAPVIPVLGKLKHENCCEFKADLAKIVNLKPIWIKSGTLSLTNKNFNNFYIHFFWSRLNKTSNMNQARAKHVSGLFRAREMP